MSDDKVYISHVLELRARFIRCLILSGIIFCLLMFFSNSLFEWAAHFLSQSASNAPALIATEIASPFIVPLKLAFMLTLFISIPYWLYQIWQFVMPALYPKERQPIMLLSLLSMGLFYLGVAFSYFLVCPLTMKFFAYMAPENVLVMTDIQHFLSFITKMLLSFGAAFQVPIIVCLCLLSGVVSESDLKSKRPYIIIAAFVIGMLLTPPDVISQLMLALPILGLFEFGLLLGRFLKKRPSQITHDVHQP